jgi:hypothetical protein
MSFHFVIIPVIIQRVIALTRCSITLLHVLLTINLSMKEIAAIIDRWKINKALLASKIGMKASTFNNKLNEGHDSQFTDLELIHLKGVLIELREELGVIEGGDFNESLEKITKGIV